MKPLISIIATLVVLMTPRVLMAQAVMENYCSAPPFVTNTVPPNIMILMDNSKDMLKSAYIKTDGTYIPGAAGAPNTSYEGYFANDKYYEYGSSKFEISTGISPNPGTTTGPTTIASGNKVLFRGDLLNWATTSRFDLLMKVLIGGKSTSRQANDHTLVSESGDWNKTYNGCKFEVSGAQLTIKDDSGTSCSLLNPLPTAIALNMARPPATMVASQRLMMVASSLEGLGRLLGNLISEVYAAPKPVRIATAKLPDGELTLLYSKMLEANDGTPSYTWSISAGALPPGISLNTSTGELSGTPTVDAGCSTYPCTYSFTVKVTDSAGGIDTRVLDIKIKVSTSTRILGPMKVRIVPVGGSGTEQKGIVQDFLGKARWGLMDYRKGKAYIEEEFKDRSTQSDIASFVTAIQNIGAESKAPLSKGYYGILQYLKYQSGGPSGPDWYGPAPDPFGTDTIKCRKTFVLTLSSVKNLKGGDNAQLVDSSCLATYTYPKKGVPTTKDATDVPLIKHSCFGYKNDLRSPTLGLNDKPGTQNLYHYGVFTFGDPDDCGDLDDLDTNEGCDDNAADDSPRAKNKAILEASTQAGGGKQEGRTQFYDAGSGGLKEAIVLAITDILKRAASGTAVSVLTTSSRDVGSLVQAYFLASKQEGTRQVTWTGYLQNIWVDPFDNLREDTVKDSNLKLAEDKVAKIYFDVANNETKVGLFTTDQDGNSLSSTAGSLASCSLAGSGNPKPLADLSSLWESGQKLALRSPSTRTLFTSTNVVRTSGISATQTATATATTTIAANTFNASTVTGNPTLNAALNADATYTVGNIVGYIRGECLETGATGDDACGSTANTTYRDRRISVTGGGTNGNVWKLGDVISSTPKVFANTPLNTYNIDYGDGTYTAYTTSTTAQQRSGLAFVGANDGVLHAFRVGYLKNTGLASGVKALFKKLFSSADNATSELGEEVWGYLPYNSFPYLKYLANPNYCHVYFNDLSVRLVDASINGLPSDVRTQSSWQTILIGGMRLGGGCATGTPAPPLAGVGLSSYFALNITDPENPVPLWEFSDDDLGYATTFPSILRTGSNSENGRWYLAIGSGSTQLPKGSTDIARSTTGYVYILDLKSGTLVKKIPLDHNAIVGDILAIDANKDYAVEKLYFGTAHTVSGAWKGKVTTITIPNQDLASTWTPTVTYLFDDNYPFTASPDATKDANGNLWVYIGSGKYYSDLDESDTQSQIFVGFKDVTTGITYPLSTTGSVSPLDNRTTTTTTGTVASTAQVCTYDQTAAAFQMKTVVTSISPTSTGLSPSVNGWYLALGTTPTRERVITRPLAVGGLVDFLTYQPSADLCASGGDSYLYSVDYQTGAAPTVVAIRDAGITGGVTSGAVTVAKGVKLGPGAPPTGEAIIIPAPKDNSDTLKKKIQVATGVIVEAENKPVISVASKVIHWLKK